jgi:hypothetical protein
MEFKKQYHMGIKRTIKWSSLILISTIFLYLLYFFTPYLITSKDKLYDQGVLEMKQGIDYDVIKDEHLLKAVINFRIAMFKGYKERTIFINTYWCYKSLGNHWYSSIETVLTKGLQYYPKDIEFYFRRANARAELKEFNRALSDYDMVISLDKGREYEYITEAFYERGAVRYILYDQNGAKKDFIMSQEMSSYEFREYQDYCKKWE